MFNRSNINSGSHPDIKAQLQDIKSTLQQATQSTGEQAEALRAKSLALVDTAMDAVQQIPSSVIAKGRQAVGKTADYVQDKPWNAIGISAVIGVLVGMLLTRD